MAEKEKSGRDIGNGLSEVLLPHADEEDPGGTGGGAGGGTIAGRGEPSGGLLSGTAATTAGLTNDNIAAEAAALGSADGALADEDQPHGPSGDTGPAGTAGPGEVSRR